jgi:hypothetical protein
MKIVYRVSPAWIGEMIKEVEVSKETKEIIWARLKGMRNTEGKEIQFAPVARVTKHYEHYQTWKEAHGRLVELATKKLFAVEKDLRMAKYHLRQAQLLKPKSHFEGFLK